MQVSLRDIRIASLVGWFDLTEDSDLQNRIINELWCLRNDVDTTALHDITVADVPTSDIIRTVLSNPARSRNENAAFIVCTLHEIS